MVRNGGAAAVALLAGGEQQAIHLSAPGSSDGTSALILGRGTSRYIVDDTCDCR